MSTRKFGFEISRYNRDDNRWHWCGHADAEGSTTAWLPEDVYEQMPLPVTEHEQEFVSHDGNTYRIERVWQ